LDAAAAGRIVLVIFCEGGREGSGQASLSIRVVEAWGGAGGGRQVAEQVKLQRLFSATDSKDPLKIFLEEAVVNNI